MDKKEFKKLVKKFWKRHSVIIIYSIAVLLFISISFLFFRALIPAHAELGNAKEDDGNSLNNPDKITIDISKDRISPNEIKMQPGRFYDFTFRKNFETNCNGLVIPSLDINISLLEREKTLPFRINSEGEYAMNCVGETGSTKLIVKK